MNNSVSMKRLFSIELICAGLYGMVLSIICIIDENVPYNVKYNLNLVTLNKLVLFMNIKKNKTKYVL